MPDRTPISALPAQLIAAIAAGEVIERPATIVKELVENALDAGATQIQISLQNGGLDQIIVADNGEGIPAEELTVAVERHTTNKLSALEDFAALLSYGFRGEALASIASMSSLTLKSRTSKQAQGAEIKVVNGKVGETSPIGMAAGTQVIVEDIFAGLPARRKFLGTPAQERKAILECVTKIAVAVPEVGFIVKEENTTHLAVVPQKTLIDRLAELFGTEFTEQLWPFTHTSDKLSFVGFLGSPRLARRSKPLQFLSVNRRPVHQPSLNALIRQSYASSLEPKSSPAFIVFVEIAPDQIDVNVHPRKESVQWQDEKFVTSTLEETIQKNFAAEQKTSYSPTPPYQLSVNDSASLLPYVHRTLPLLHDALKNSAPTWYHALASRGQTVLQVQNTYLVTETAEGLMIIDQHAAHERVLYQQFVELFQQQIEQQKIHQLERPVVFHVSPAAAAAIEEHAETFTRIGFEIEPFGEHAFMVRSVPESLREHDIQKVIEDVVEDIQQHTPLQGIDQLTHRTLAYLACRSAVKAGDPLTSEQAKTLLEKLQNTPFAFSCPHGRPTIQTFSWQEVGKWFQRK